MLAALVLAAAIDSAAANRAFAELETMCRDDGGKMYRASLCGPVVFADPSTREAIARKDGKTFTATIPQSIGIANTSVEWDGDLWTMVVWPLPKDDVLRRVLLAHESFHRHQRRGGIAMKSPGNNHLDTVQGRYLQRLEWRALLRAVQEPDHAVEAMSDALAFRTRRHALSATAGTEERDLEMNEGVANHTGYALAVPDVVARAPHLAALVAKAEKEPNYVRSFAYTTGPLYGAVLDRVRSRWTRWLDENSDLATMAGVALRVRPSPGLRPPSPARAGEGSRDDGDGAGRDPSPAAAGEGARRADEGGDIETRSLRYGGPGILAEEAKRDEERQARLAAFRKRLVDGPLLILPLGKFSMTLDPDGLTPLDDRGTVYRTITIRDAWGMIEAQDALLTADFKRLIVPAPASADAIEGDRWKLSLAGGWRVVEGKRAGDFVVDKQ
jgi:hypothetical protein